MNKLKRVLCILSNMNTGGAETFLMKIYRHLDKENYQMDFCLNQDDNFYDDEIQKMGGQIYVIPSKSQDLKGFRDGLTELVSTKQYQYVLRITSNAAGFMDLKVAKKAGAKICAVRSSNSSDGLGLKTKIAHCMGRILYGMYVDVKMAPSVLAANYTFGKRNVKNGKVFFLNNGIDLDIYKFNEFARNEKKKEFGIEHNLVIGHIGRFMTQKNHMFLLDVFSAISKKRSDAILLLVGGNGDLEKQVRKKVCDLDLENKVVFAGIRSDIPELLSAMDVFVMPSLYEGMPNTVIEAQATGLPCVIADTITREANITGLVDYLPLSLEAECWADKVISKASAKRGNTHNDFVSKGYDIQSVANKFVKLICGE